MRRTPTPLLPLGGAAAGPRLDRLQALLALQIPFGAARRHPEFTGVQIGRCQMRTAVVGWRRKLGAGGRLARTRCRNRH